MFKANNCKINHTLYPVECVCVCCACGANIADYCIVYDEDLYAMCNRCIEEMVNDVEKVVEKKIHTAREWKKEE